MALNMQELIQREDLYTGGNPGCKGCGATIAMRQAMKVLGERTMMIIPASCMATLGGSNLNTAWKVPFFHALFECSAAVASGVRAGLEIQGKKGINVVSWAGDAGTADIGFQSLTGAAERNEDIIHVCYDNEIYMNTGGQAGSATPLKATTNLTPAGKPTEKKDMLAIMEAHRPVYLASASIAYPEDFMQKVAKAAGFKGFRYLHVLAPCYRGWRIPPEKTVEYARMAVESGLWELYEIENGVRRTTVVPKRRIPVRDYIRGQGRFAKFSEEDIDRIQALVDARSGTGREGE